jgi:hypothetical protein
MGAASFPRSQTGCDTLKDHPMLMQTNDNRRPSACGRPRRVTDAMIVEILAWYAAPHTLAQKAAELGIATNTLKLVIITGGLHYKQPSPEHRIAVVQSAQRRRAYLRKTHWI